MFYKIKNVKFVAKDNIYFIVKAGIHISGYNDAYLTTGRKCGFYSSAVRQLKRT